MVYGLLAVLIGGLPVIFRGVFCMCFAMVCLKDSKMLNDSLINAYAIVISGVDPIRVNPVSVERVNTVVMGKKSQRKLGEILKSGYGLLVRLYQLIIATPLSSLFRSLLWGAMMQGSLIFSHQQKKASIWFHSILSGQQLLPSGQKSLADPRDGVEAEQCYSRPVLPSPRQSYCTHSPDQFFRSRRSMLKRLKPLPS